MYNIDFLPQLEASRRHLFGSRSPEELPSSPRYVPLNILKVVECVEDVNGEWVPRRALERKAEYR